MTTVHQDFTEWQVAEWLLLAEHGTSAPLPFPLTTAVFDSPVTEDEQALVHSEIRARLQPPQRELAKQLTNTIHNALHTLSIYGGVTGEPAHPQQVRAHLSITDDKVALLAQAPGATAETAGDLSIWFGPRDSAAAQLAQLLPVTQAATGKVITATQDEIDGDTPGRSFLDPEPTDDDRIRALGRHTRTSDITIQLDKFVQESPLHSTSHTTWITFANKGAYLLEKHGRRFTLTPAGHVTAATHALNSVPRPEIPMDQFDDDDYYSRR